VSKENIEKSGSRDLAELLQDTLNLGTLSYGGYGNSASVNLRGFDAQRVAFLVDGVLANSPITGGFDFAVIAPESIENIEVIEGGSDNSFNTSGALGGVVNIITTKKQAPGLRVNGSLSNTSYLPVPFMNNKDESASRQWQDLADSQRAAVSAGFGTGIHSLSANLFATRAANHFPFRDGDNIVRRKSNSEVWDTGIAASYTRDLPYSASVSLKTNAYFAHKNIPGSSYSDDFDEQESRSLRGTLLFDMPRAFSDQWAAELTLDYNFLNSVFAGDGQSLHHIQAVNRWTWFPTERFVLKMGADYSFAELLAHETRFTNDGGVYLTAYIQPHRKFLVAPSVKAALREESIVPVPKLGLLWRITDGLSLKNNYYRSFKHPDMEDLYWDDGVMTGNPNLKSEDGWGGDVSLSFKKDSFTIDGALFAQWTRDSIHWYPSGNTWKPQNAGEAAFWGCKVEADAVLPVPLILQAVFKTAKLSLSYQLLESRLLTNGALWEDDKRIPYTPTHIAGFALEGNWGVGLIIVSGHFESERFADTANARELAPFFLLNLNVRQKIGSLTFFATIRNVLNVSYQTFIDYPLPGISGTLGITYSAL
ncbi:MAG: TonB-dependent receptor, partial [Treponema sp.]|nr:TonB-dependent receptor [Treponema sp.]